MAAARTGRKPPSIRTLWAIAKSPELHMTDEDLHALVYRETGKESIKALTQGQISEVARVLQNMKDSAARSSRAKRTDEGGNPETAALRRKIFVLMKELGWSPAQVDGLAKRMFHVERQEWLDKRQCMKLAEALKAMAERKAAGDEG
ncbi:regulatory protein GemA [uncultured Oscillibacter sp.]|uniref:regulatory protein GemA n=1 Tax=uncultured Oscillibacter sp. TaxID=876091 RepID=UPI0025CFF259|nr:regulatory protein GemA [uncultured Oscillibacter sp.]